MKSQTARVGDMATIILGLSPRSITYNRDGRGLPLVNGPADFGAVYPDRERWTTASRRECKAGDILFCVRGATAGRMNRADRRYSLGRGVCAIRGASDPDTRYLGYCLEYLLPALLGRSGGTNFPILRYGDLANLEIPYVPDLSLIHI